MSQKETCIKLLSKHKLLREPTIFYLILLSIIFRCMLELYVKSFEEGRNHGFDPS